MFNFQVFAQLLASATILLAGPIVILLLALKKGNL
uniref:Photosystem II reaction center protein Psb30 n=1 Tax=Rhizochromulina marina TaxID=1034831 RepID=A0A514CPS6_9STRA|nr:photosystem II reaction center protein psb30 [Rhizochromulina marina]QDH81792.1 photosystem II reaction center protein psb30 [Rhizochromulina marina]